MNKPDPKAWIAQRVKEPEFSVFLNTSPEDAERAALQRCLTETGVISDSQFEGFKAEYLVYMRQQLGLPKSIPQFG